VTLVIADYSEFQGEVHPPPNQIVIIRAHNGWRPDNYFAKNRADAHAAGCPAVGLYQYLPATANPAIAAGQLLQTVGRLAANEWLICDLEEGAGDQQPRWQSWRNPILAATFRSPWLYSGLAFSAAHDLQPEWLAAYQGNEPGAPHKLWQNTDVYPWPWGQADGSVFDGTLPQFLDSAGISLTGPVIQGADMYPSGKLAAPILAVYDRPNHPGQGWRFAADGGVFPFGGAPTFGNPTGTKLAAPIVGAAVAENGYTLIGSDGGSFPYGPEAPHVESLA
jgi:hypothetical protein